MVKEWDALAVEVDAWEFLPMTPLGVLGDEAPVCLGDDAVDIQLPVQVWAWAMSRAVVCSGECYGLINLIILLLLCLVDFVGAVVMALAWSSSCGCLRWCVDWIGHPAVG